MKGRPTALIAPVVAAEPMEASKLRSCAGSCRGGRSTPLRRRMKPSSFTSTTVAAVSMKEAIQETAQAVRLGGR